MKYIEFDMSRPMDLILLGRVAIDFNPAYNDQVKEEFKPLKKVHMFEKFVGGSPANIAVGVTRHGLKAGFIGKVSDDQFGDFVTEYFKEQGIDTSHITRFTIERTKGRIPVIAGTGSNCTATAMELSAEAASYGSDGVLVVTPYYNKATQKGMIRHFTKVAEAAKIPVVLYNVPSRTGCRLEAETVAELVNHVDNIVAMKEASGDFSNIAKMMELTDGKLDLYSGNDDQIVPLMSLGGKGVISVLSNVAPKAAHDICQLYLDGEVKASCALQLKALPLIHALFSEVNPIPVKKAVELMGLCGGTVREPLTELEPEHTEILRQEMLKFGLQV